MKFWKSYVFWSAFQETNKLLIFTDIITNVNKNKVITFVLHKFFRTSGSVTIVLTIGIIIILSINVVID